MSSERTIYILGYQQAGGARHETVTDDHDYARALYDAWEDSLTLDRSFGALHPDVAMSCIWLRTGRFVEEQKEVVTR